MNYLKYLRYWKKPEFAKYIKYPMCLHFLDLLQYEHFRKEISNSQCAKFIEDQQLLHWQYYIRKRTRLLQAASNPDGNAASATDSADNLAATNQLSNSVSQVSLQ